MRKQFMKTTALVAAALIGGAGSAALAQNKASVSVGGYYQGDIGLPISNPGTADKAKHATVDYHAESEVHFNGSAKLDNGLTLRVRWELEGDADGSPAPNADPPNGNNTLGGLDPIDEAYVTISGAFGQLVLGSTDNAPTKMVTGYLGSWPTGVAQNLAFDSFEWTQNRSAQFHTTRDSRANNFDGDAEKISYFTPRISGVQLGLSYTPNNQEQVTGDSSGTRGQADAVNAYHNGYAVGVNWTGGFDAVKVGLAGGYVRMKAPSGGTLQDPVLWTTGMRIDSGPVRVAGGIKKITKGSLRPQGQIFDIGTRYTMGPNRFSLTFSHGKVSETVGSRAGNAKGDQSQAMNLGFARTIGPGTRWHANLIRNRAKLGGNANNAWALATGFRINF